MADNKSKRGGPDRARVASEQQYEVDYFAKKHGLTEEAAQRIIALSGPSRAEADAAAEETKKR